MRLALTVFVASVFSMWLVYRVLGQVNQLIYIWPLTGVQLGILLPEWMNCRSRLRSQLAGVLGVFTGGCIMGLPFWFALAIACLSGIDVWIAGIILSKGVRGFEDLKRRENLVLFVIAATVGPLVVGLLAGLPVALFLHEYLLRTSIISALSDSLGMAIVLPALLFLLTGTYRNPRLIAPFLKKGIPAAILFTLVAAGVFWQTDGPLLFMIFPPMVLMVLAMGLEGAVYSSVILALIACYATAHGHGPLWLARVQVPENRLLLLQMFLWMSVATALPVGALLDEQRSARKDADEARSIYQTLLQNTDDMIILSSMDGSRRYISAACEKLTGWTPEEFMALDRMKTFHPEDRDMAMLVMESMRSGKREHVFRYRLAQKKGGWRWVEASARTYLDEKTKVLSGYVGTVHDISEIKQTEEVWQQEREELTREKLAMADLARTDSLTMLPNRRSFDEGMRKYFKDARRSGNEVSLMMIDVDFFKLYNDRYGHQAGDACLQAIGQVLQARVGRENDMVARWGGEEFGVLLPGAGIAGAERVALSMLEAVRDLKIEHEDNPRGLVTISIGIAGLDELSMQDPSLWIQQADRALYWSKRSGKDCVTLASSILPATGIVHGTHTG
jgi:diguanylate cyclase (GGDEF)-like protein/PAS domain S-box-containing protein